MIDRAATIEKFGYDPDTLSHGSNKKVVAICEMCGKVRDVVKNAYHDLCQSCARKKYFEDPEARKKTSVANKRRFEDPKERKKTSVANIKRYEDPGERKKHSVALKKYFEDHPETRKKTSAANKKRFEDPKEREKNRAAMKKHYEDPKAKKKQSVVMKKHYEDPEARKKTSAASKKRYEDPIARKKQSAAMKKHYEDPKEREKLSVSQKKFFEDPEARKKRSAAAQGIPYEQWEAFAREHKYCPAFNETCRESNREKYGRRCFLCDLPESKNITKTGKQKKLSVHHVDMNKDQGCDGHEWKLIPTCMHHHGATHNPTWIGRIAYLLRVGA